MRGILVLMTLLLVAVVALIATRARHDDSVRTPIATPEPSAAAMPVVAAPRTPVPNPYKHLDVLGFTPEQLQALLAAGMAIQEGRVPSRTLSSEQLATFPEIERTLAAHVCPPGGSADACTRYRVDVPQCLDRAGEIVAWRRRERDRVDRKLFIAAMGVSVTGREFPTFANLVRFCRDMTGLDRAHGAPGMPQSPEARSSRP